MWAISVLLGHLVLSQAYLQQSSKEQNLDHIPRIAGGNKTTIETYPYMASVRDAPTGVHICGGSIVAHHWVLTAAQCVHGNLTEIYKIRAGSTNINDGDEHSLEQIVIHPNYMEGDISSYDIAVVKVVEAFIYSSSVQPVKLAPAGIALAVGTMAAVAGWGATPLGQEAGVDLLAVEVEVVSGNECNTAYGSKFSEDTMICVNHADVQQGACVNDEGSALVENSIQIGVVSLTTACYEGWYNRGPGIYTRVSYFTNWIMAETSA